MDFCKLLHKAQKNEQTSSGAPRYYSTKFEPPKKIKKEKKDLSENIKKFLAKKEAEEQKKLDEAQRKKEDLLALRSQDKKATRRVNVMLKRTKSANQSVIQDAVDQTHTAVTSSGPEQPDEDDYGYVSQEASALYEKMMEKYSQMPVEPKYNMFKKKVSTNLSSTKDRVKAALDKEREEAMMPHRRKRKSKQEGVAAEENKDDDGSPERKKTCGADAPSSSLKEKEKVKPKPRPAGPPPVSFTELLKIAAQKQHEPIVIEEKVVEEERLYTKRQRQEMERERLLRERKEQREKEYEERAKNPNKPIIKPTSSGSGSSILEKQLTKKVSFDNGDKDNKNRPKLEKDRIPMKQEKQPSNDGLKKPPNQLQNKSISQKSDDNRPSKGENRGKINGFNGGKPVANGSSKPSLPSSKASDQRMTKTLPSTGASKEMAARKDFLQKKPNQVANGKPKEFPPRDLIPKGKPKEFPPRDLKPKQFPPADVKRLNKKKPIVASRGRIIDDDDDDEYDSELDDFIDDGDADVDVSSCIKEIFGYDKSRYRDHDDDVDNMESTFAQQMREEVVSAKIGIMEDLEDMKKEEEEKRRKALMKKKMRR
ncbi:protein SPT2 homolog [Anthonomus grandis grandis]|uniref:protein SPT2 homolog n=1 Tax=Anthonomus grandis grandis TaxID=2921223 RepID=UPI002165B63E|nr:protein SPT2 homolog [Anthonomus grandis grandis]